MGFKQRRARRAEAKADASAPSEFRHVSGYADIAGVIGDHTLDSDAEPHLPKGYRGRSLPKDEPKRR